MLHIKRLNTSDETFWQDLDALPAWEAVADDQILETVRDILQNVRRLGDEAVVEYSNRFDRTRHLRRVPDPEGLSSEDKDF